MSSKQQDQYAEKNLSAPDLSAANNKLATFSSLDSQCTENKTIPEHAEQMIARVYVQQ